MKETEKMLISRIEGLLRGNSISPECAAEIRLTVDQCEKEDK